VLSLTTIARECPLPTVVVRRLEAAEKIMQVVKLETKYVAFVRLQRRQKIGASSAVGASRGGRLFAMIGTMQ